AAREQQIRAITGCELTMENGTLLPVLVANRIGYKNLCELLTQAHLRSSVKGECAMRWTELPEFTEGLIALGSGRILPAGFGISPKQSSQTPRKRDAFPSTQDRCSPQNPDNLAQLLIDSFGRENVYVEIQRHFLRGEDRINKTLVDLASEFRLPLLATNGVQYARPYGRRVLDVFTCIREHTHLDLAGKLLTPNAERHLKRDSEMRVIFRDLPDA